MIDLDGTPNKSRLGANAILGVSLACAKRRRNPSTCRCIVSRRHLGADVAGPMMNINQWRRARRQSDRLPGIQIMPVGAKTFAEALRCGSESPDLRGELKKAVTMSRRRRVRAEPAVGGCRA